MRREDQIFQGYLKDKELYLIEDTLTLYKNPKFGKTKKEIRKIDKLIEALYKFWEVEG